MVWSQSSSARLAAAVAVVCAGPVVAQANGAGTGVSASSTAGGRVSAPPANSAMRRAGSGTVSAQPVTGAAQSGMATPTNAMTLNGGESVGGTQPSNGQPSAQPSSGVSIDSNGITRRANEMQTPR